LSKRRRDIARRSFRYFFGRTERVFSAFSIRKRGTFRRLIAVTFASYLQRTISRGLKLPFLKKKKTVYASGSGLRAIFRILPRSERDWTSVYRTWKISNRNIGANVFSVKSRKTCGRVRFTTRETPADTPRVSRVETAKKTNGESIFAVPAERTRNFKRTRNAHGRVRTNAAAVSSAFREDVILEHVRGFDGRRRARHGTIWPDFNLLPVSLR